MTRRKRVKVAIVFRQGKFREIKLGPGQQTSKSWRTCSTTSDRTRRRPQHRTQVDVAPALSKALQSSLSELVKEEVQVKIISGGGAVGSLKPTSTWRLLSTPWCSALTSAPMQQRADR